MFAILEPTANLLAWSVTMIRCTGVGPAWSSRLSSTLSAPIPSPTRMPATSTPPPPKAVTFSPGVTLAARILKRRGSMQTNDRPPMMCDPPCNGVHPLVLLAALPPPAAPGPQSCGDNCAATPFQPNHHRQHVAGGRAARQKDKEYFAANIAGRRVTGTGDR